MRRRLKTFEERSIIDQITVLEDGQIQVRRADKVLLDGDESRLSPIKEPLGTPSQRAEFL